MVEQENLKKDSLVEASLQNQAPNAINQVLIIIEHKIRNLEKRKGKLDGYKEILKSGQDLNADQEIALERYEEVCNSLDLSRDYIKQFQTIANVANKEAKRERRKEAYLKQQNEIAKVREVLIIQDTLTRLKEESVRLDFLAGTNNATKIDEDDMNLLEKFLIEVTPTRPLRSNEPSFVTSTQNAADVLSNVVDGKPKEFGTSTYSHVRDVLQKIQTCGYFEKDIVTVAEPEGAGPEVEVKENEDLESVSETADATEERGAPVMVEEQRKVMTGTVGGGPESIPEMVLNHREQTPIQQQHHQQQQLPVLTPTPIVLPNNKEFGGPEPMAPSAKNVPVPMFKCSPQLVHQIPLPQQPAPIQVAPTLMGNVGIVPPQVVAPVVSPTNLQHIAPTTVRAVEQAYFKHAQFMQHQSQPMRPQPPQPQPIHEVIGTANFFFLQESELDSPDIPSPAPGFPVQPPLQQHHPIAAINTNKPSQQPTPPPLTHNHNIVPASAQIQPPLPTNVNLHHNPSPIPVQTPPHLSQPQMQHGAVAPGIPTQTFTNHQSFSSVAPVQNKAPQQIFSPPGLGRSPASNTSATFNSVPNNHHKSNVEMSQPHIPGFQAAAAIAVAVTPLPGHQQQQQKPSSVSVASLNQPHNANNNGGSNLLGTATSTLSSGLGYNSISTATNSNIPGFSTNNIQPFSHFQQVSAPNSGLQQQQQPQQQQPNLSKHNDEQVLTEKLKSSLNISDRKASPQQSVDTNSNDDVKDWNLMNNDHQNNNSNSNNDSNHWNSGGGGGGDENSYSRYGGRRSAGNNNGGMSRGGSNRDVANSSSMSGGGGGYRGRSNNYANNGNNNSNNNYGGYGNNRQTDVGNGGNTTFFRNNDRYQNGGGGYSNKSDYGRSTNGGGNGGYVKSSSIGGTRVGPGGGMNNGQNDYRSARSTNGSGGNGNSGGSMSSTRGGSSYQRTSGSTRSQAT